MAGNATITLLDGTHEVYLVAFSTSNNTQYESDQVHRGMSWFPIRRSEMTINFTIAWPLRSALRPNGFQDMQNFQDSLRRHQQSAVLSAGPPTPMILNYLNNSGPNFNPIIGKQKKAEVYHGWVQTVQKTFPRFIAYFTQSYQMNVLVPQAENESIVVETGAFGPTSTTVNQVGQSWTSNPVFMGNEINFKAIPGGK